MHLVIHESRLRPKWGSVERDWRLWEWKSFGVHRGVVEVPSDARFGGIDTLGARVHEVVRAEFRPGWFRGLAFGTIFHFPTPPTDLSKLNDFIDTHARLRAVWLFAIACFTEPRAAVGLHTWQPGLLRPTFDELMRQLADGGFRCLSLDKEMGPWMKRLHRVGGYDPHAILVRKIEEWIWGR